VGARTKALMRLVANDLQPAEDAAEPTFREAAEAAAAALAAERDRAQQLNPACTAYWTSRGYSIAPHALKWPLDGSIVATSGALARAACSGSSANNFKCSKGHFQEDRKCRHFARWQSP